MSDRDQSDIFTPIGHHRGPVFPADLANHQMTRLVHVLRGDFHPVRVITLCLRLIEINPVLGFVGRAVVLIVFKVHLEYMAEKGDSAAYFIPF